MAHVWVYSPQKRLHQDSGKCDQQKYKHILVKKNTHPLEILFLKPPDTYKMPNIVLILNSAYAKQFLLGGGKLNLVQ